MPEPCQEIGFFARILTPGVPVIARRPKADEAISALKIGFVFAER